MNMAARISEKGIVSEIPSVLAKLLDVPKGGVKVKRSGGPEADMLIQAAGHTFAVEVIGTGSSGPVAAHAEHIVSAAKKLRYGTIPLLVVPFMTETGRRAAEGAQVSWFDLSGNSHIIAPGLRVIIDGRPNQFRGPGRPSSVFAPKSARVVRWLLMHPGQSITQRELARATEMSEGFVSRIASRLEEDSYVGREPAGAIRVKDGELLLDAWRSEYRFDRHTIIQGNIAARSGDALTRFIGDQLSTVGFEHAATGLSAAWQHTHFAAFRIATFFVEESPSPQLLKQLGFREEPRGANVWFVIPNDGGVFQGAAPREGVRCVHAVQAYVDLKGHPERAAEATLNLRAELFPANNLSACGVAGISLSQSQIDAALDWSRGER